MSARRPQTNPLDWAHVHDRERVPIGLGSGADQAKRGRFGFCQCIDGDGAGTRRTHVGNKPGVAQNGFDPPIAAVGQYQDAVPGRQTLRRIVVIASCDLDADMVAARHVARFDMHLTARFGHFDIRNRCDFRLARMEVLEALRDDGDEPPEAQLRKNFAFRGSAASCACAFKPQKSLRSPVEDIVSIAFRQVGLIDQCDRLLRRPCRRDSRCQA